MASFRIINNTNSTLPLSDSLQIAPVSERFVGQITYEMARLESLHLITIIRMPTGDADDELKPDYINTTDPTVVTTTGAPGAGTGDVTTPIYIPPEVGSGVGTGTGPGSTFKMFRNISGLPMPRGTPIFSSTPGDADMAKGDFAGRQVIGLNATPRPLLENFSGDFIIDGSLICTGPEWQAITDMPGGLVRGRKYFLDLMIPGKLRIHVDSVDAPRGSYLVSVGYAVTSTELKLEIQPSIRLA